MKQRIFLMIAVILVFAVTGVFLWQWRAADRPLDKVGAVRIAASMGLPGAPFWIAEERGLFAKAGLDTDIKGYTSGKTCAEALLKGEVELASTAEFKAAQIAFTDKSRRILGTTAFVHTIKLLVLKDKGITRLLELKGKRVGVSFSTNGEYFLARLLTLNGMKREDIIWVDLKPQTMIDALIADEIDAVLVWPPYTTKIRERFGDKLVEFDGQPGQDYYFVVLGSQEWLAKNSKIAERVMLALKWAEQWIVTHPQETKAFLAARYKTPTSELDEDLQNSRFDISLPQTLLTAMEAEYRWLAEQGAPGIRPTNSLDLIAFEPLTAVAPESVTMIRGASQP